MAVVNQAGSSQSLAKLLESTTLPVFQDNWDMGAWAMHAGKKDDFYIYTPQGELSAYFTLTGDENLDLSSEEGYQNVKEALINAN